MQPAEAGCCFCLVVLCATMLAVFFTVLTREIVLSIALTMIEKRTLT